MMRSDFPTSYFRERKMYWKLGFLPVLKHVLWHGREPHQAPCPFLSLLQFVGACKVRVGRLRSTVLDFSKFAVDLWSHILVMVLPLKRIVLYSTCTTQQCAKCQQECTLLPNLYRFGTGTWYCVLHYGTGSCLVLAHNVHEQTVGIPSIARDTKMCQHKV